MRARTRSRPIRQTATSSCARPRRARLSRLRTGKGNPPWTARHCAPRRPRRSVRPRAGAGRWPRSASERAVARPARPPPMMPITTSRWPPSDGRATGRAGGLVVGRGAGAVYASPAGRLRRRALVETGPANSGGKAPCPSSDEPSQPQRLRLRPGRRPRLTAQGADRPPRQAGGAISAARPGSSISRSPTRSTPASAASASRPSTRRTA